jgi:hypothetical protein
MKTHEIKTFSITSSKKTVGFVGTLAAAIHKAKAYNGALAPEHGTQVEADGKTVYDTEWPKFRFRTDGESGTITAPDFDNAVKQLNDMFTQQMLEDGAWGWVQDHDGYRHNIGETC